MADLSAQYAVNEALLVGDRSSIDVSDNSHFKNGSGGVGSNGEEAKLPSTTSHAPIKEQTLLPEPVQHMQGISASTEKPSNLTAEASDAVATTSDKPEHLINGDNGSYDGSDDAGYQHSASGDTIHSDPDPLRGEGAEQLGTDSKAERPGPVKRPASFKPVSVTKNFLAKSAAGAAANTKPAADKCKQKLDVVMCNCGPY